MSRYVYDDFRLTFAGRGEGTYSVRAEHDGRQWTGAFELPMPADEFEAAVLSVAGSRPSRHAVCDTRGVPAATPRQLDAAHLGSELAGALFSGDIGAAYAAALGTIDRREGRGLRLTLSLAATPELLHVPWEFLYRRPTFLAVQPHLPLVRHVEVGRRSSSHR